MPKYRQIVSIQYFNMAGQRLNGPKDANIVIRRIIYDDGTAESRKITRK